MGRLRIPEIITIVAGGMRWSVIIVTMINAFAADTVVAIDAVAATAATTNIVVAGGGGFCSVVFG